MTSPDPVAEAAAYQRHLLDALGEDDPAAAQAAIELVAVRHRHPLVRRPVLDQRRRPGLPDVAHR